LHLGAKPCGQFGVPQELPEYLVPASASFHDLGEDHVEPTCDDISRLIPTVATENTERVFGKLRYQRVDCSIFHVQHFIRRSVAPCNNFVELRSRLVCQPGVDLLEQ
jgi:hypothetical protein